MEGGRVSHSWCMCVVVVVLTFLSTKIGQLQVNYSGSHGYGGLDGGRDVERCQSTFRVRGDKMMIPDHTTIQVRSSV